MNFESAKRMDEEARRQRIDAEERKERIIQGDA
jgi:hypothetical protein